MPGLIVRAPISAQSALTTKFVKMEVHSQELQTPRLDASASALEVGKELTVKHLKPARLDLLIYPAIMEVLLLGLQILEIAAANVHLDILVQIVSQKFNAHWAH